jgi:prepilin-type N-terminal cleavage/methylation domain-containing protein
MMKANRKKKIKGFSLIELVIVVVIIGIIGAIAIPRMSRGSAGASDSALIGDLSVLRSAIDLYAAEHNGSFPALATIEDQLTKLTKADGSVDIGKGKAGGYIFGPYIRKIPSLPVGTNSGNTAFTATLAEANKGWYYSATTGVVTANLANAETAEDGTAYNTY